MACMACMARIRTPEPPWNCDGRQEQEDLCLGLEKCEELRSRIEKRLGEPKDMARMQNI